MFSGFSKEALEFLFGIRANNDKSWFEERKKIYTDRIYEPMKELGSELFEPFKDTDGMMYKIGRIYRDANFPPYLHYRDTMWIYVRYDAYYWNRTPTLYFELSPEGAEFGFRISKPEAAVMEAFRSRLTADSKPFLDMISSLEANGLTIGGDEYKRKKPCTVTEAERFFIKKGLSAYVKITDENELFSRKIAEHAADTFKQLVPLNDFFHNIVLEVEAEKSAPLPTPTETMIKAPDVEFMW